ncbi:MAG: hypothetical protein ACOYOJ_02145 [Alsobacter sp.]
MKMRLRLGIAIAGLLAPVSCLAQGQDCTWGQPGYRACVEAKIAAMKKAEAAGRPAGAKTAPANRRPPALTPLASETLRLPDVSGDPSAARRDAVRNQRQLDRNLGRQRLDAQRPLIMPDPPLIQIPGRICPSQGC